MAGETDFGSEFPVDDPFGSGFGGNDDDPFGIGEFGDEFTPGEGDDSGGGGDGFFNFDFGLAEITNLLLGLAVGASQARRANQNREDVQAQIGQAKKFASPENFIDVFKTLQPIFQEIVGAGAGPQLSGAILSNLAKSGGKDTGRGAALAAAGAAAGDTLALNLTAAETGNIQRGQVGAALGGAGASIQLGPKRDPLIDALAGGAAGFFGTAALPKKDDRGTGAQPNASLFPNIRST